MFSGPTNIATFVNDAGATILYVTDAANNAVRVITLPAKAAANNASGVDRDEGKEVEVKTLIADVGNDGALSMPTGVALNPKNDELYVNQFIGFHRESAREH